MSYNTEAEPAPIMQDDSISFSTIVYKEGCDCEFLFFVKNFRPSACMISDSLEVEGKRRGKQENPAPENPCRN